MRKHLFFIAIIIAITSSAFAQNPFGFNYQMVVRDASSNTINNKSVGIQMSILQSDASGAVVYQETFVKTTNAYGLVSLEIGSGTAINGSIENIDWNADAFYLETAIDESGGNSYKVIGTSKLASVPYSLYSQIAGYADSADYNSLTNLPITITNEQIAKIDSITITSGLDLDQMAADVAINNEKVSFPGFGTVPGTALEGNNIIWNIVEDNLFYDGSVGIGVDTTSDFGGSVLHVGGGILYDGIPSANTPGILYYDTTGAGSFRYYDNSGNNIVLGAKYKWTSEAKDAVIVNDVIVDGSLAVGQDAVNGEDFGFNTIIIKENNLRILFDDTDSITGDSPSNDWQIEINESSNGGTSHFAIKDITSETTPFKIMAGAPTNSFFINSYGNIGIGTNTPVSKLDVNGIVKASSFIGDGSGLTGITGGTGGISNIDTTVISADTDANGTGEIAFQTQNVTKVLITNDGKVGIGTEAPVAMLDVNGSGSFESINASGNVSAGSIVYKITSYTDPGENTLDFDVSNKSVIIFNTAANQTIDGFSAGIEGQEISITTIQAEIIINHNGAGTQKILLPGSVNKTLTLNSSARFICDGTNWYCIGINTL
ncbi:MAG: hypothetical protein JEY96_13900 [Bacteroidales bacterium]|nr:hypothetical protein [Bacteroidales bacterium]